MLLWNIFYIIIIIIIIITTIIIINIIWHSQPYKYNLSSDLQLSSVTLKMFLILILILEK